jgi:hypothetical protein
MLAALQRPIAEDAIPVEPEHQRLCVPRAVALLVRPSSRLRVAAARNLQGVS